MPVPCTPDDAVATKIVNSCDTAFPNNNDDCNKFVKAALGDFLTGGYFDGLDADGIVSKLQEPAEGWATSRHIATAIQSAKDGNVVIAGMSSSALGQTHGHLAVVVGCDGQVSGSVMVPVGYAGSLDNPAARLNGGRLSGTFKATLVRSEGIDYYVKAPDRTPT